MPTTGKRKSSATDASVNPAPAKKAAKNKLKNKENRRPKHADAPVAPQPSATANASTTSAHVAAANTNIPGPTAVAARNTANAEAPPIDPALLIGSVHTLQDQLRDAHAEITKLKASKAAGNVPVVVKKIKKIPRPETGSAGHGFNLQEMMGLANKKEKYEAILRTIRSIIQQANVDFKLTWHEQDLELIGRCIRLARKRQPYLKRFIRDWATEEYIKTHLKNKRHYEKRRAKKKAALNNEGGEDGNDNDSDSDNDSDDDSTEGSSEESSEGEESGGEELRAISDEN